MQWRAERLPLKKGNTTRRIHITGSTSLNKALWGLYRVHQFSLRGGWAYSAQSNPSILKNFSKITFEFDPEDFAPGKKFDNKADLCETLRLLIVENVPQSHPWYQAAQDAKPTIQFLDRNYNPKPDPGYWPLSGRLQLDLDLGDTTVFDVVNSLVSG
eukprot:TRINITY_DN38037_c0_g1_i1.p1 TRINITY_DN38037_c0_g1~~TRINITY_DN38037_c0_g1_i1.p1  ORF type:complete len:157 (+),score=19.24 TRINITY_DN38037_c0_g1_i1:605-1075(+)